ncbi:hypothetical protein BCR44DRAFT_34002 [Catenaria anguillulae PL171]|uniref:Mediator of RNA polymerase II transcription subunit 21 n=1 Tax=Catenaria anguillulae PL171 TaxID=765915 RepID=A0A1Y2HUC5_9FUNG|nr:hypothetical protein BCR44DRAFT_34002 [Catenaria anguillulae PL171]
MTQASIPLQMLPIQPGGPSQAIVPPPPPPNPSTFPHLADLESAISNDDLVSKLLDRISDLALAMQWSTQRMYELAPQLPVNDAIPVRRPNPMIPQDPEAFKRLVGDMARDITRKTRTIVDEVAKLPMDPVTLESFQPTHDRLKIDAVQASNELGQAAHSAESLLTSIRTVRRQILDLEMQRAKERAIKDLEREERETRAAFQVHPDITIPVPESDAQVHVEE